MAWSLVFGSCVLRGLVAWSAGQWSEWRVGSGHGVMMHVIGVHARALWFCTACRAALCSSRSRPIANVVPICASALEYRALLLLLRHPCSDPTHHHRHHNQVCTQPLHCGYSSPLRTGREINSLSPTCDNSTKRTPRTNRALHVSVGDTTRAQNLRSVSVSVTDCVRVEKLTLTVLSFLVTPGHTAQL